MKKLLFLLFFILTTTGLIISVKADMGPKPKTTIEIIGLDQPYVFDLLYKSNKEINVLSETEVLERIENYYYLDYFPEELNGYVDDEGFHSYTLYRGIPNYISFEEPNKFIAGYFSPPDVFKIALVLESGEIIVSEVVNKTLFDANFTFDLSDFSIENATPTFINGKTVYQLDDTVTELIPVGRSILQFVLTALATIFIEVFILFVFRYKLFDSYKLVVIVNLITQTLLYASMVIGYLGASLFGYLGVLIIGEIIVFTLEIIGYFKFLKEKPRSMAIMYAITANIASLVVGLFVMSWLMV
jgi:hypothetical protein